MIWAATVFLNHRYVVYVIETTIIGIAGIKFTLLTAFDRGYSDFYVSISSANRIQSYKYCMWYMVNTIFRDAIVTWTLFIL